MPSLHTRSYPPGVTALLELSLGINVVSHRGMPFMFLRTRKGGLLGVACEDVLEAISPPTVVMGRRVLPEGGQNYETFKEGRAGSDWKKRSSGWSPVTRGVDEGGNWEGLGRSPKGDREPMKGFHQGGSQQVPSQRVEDSTSRTFPSVSS